MKVKMAMCYGLGEFSSQLRLSLFVGDLQPHVTKKVLQLLATFFLFGPVCFTKKKSLSVGFGCVTSVHHYYTKQPGSPNAFF